MTKISFSRTGVWSWPRVSFNPGKYVSMNWFYFGTFFLFIRVYHTPYDNEGMI